MSSIPVLKDSKERKESIINNTPAIFDIVGNSSADGSEPFYELGFESQVVHWCDLTTSVARKYGVNPDLVRAIMYVETTHGWYDALYPFKKTILPMNINYKYWRKLGVTKELLGCPYYNIVFGVILISRIKARIRNPTPAKVASIYNFLGAEKVDTYGARVARVFKLRPWSQKGCRP